MYWEQYFGDKQALLESITDPVQKTFAEINYGPWDRTNGKSFVEGYQDRLPGAGFYPADMTVEEFNSKEPIDIANQYFIDKYGEPMNEEQREMFNMIYQAVQEANRQ
jgi:hypothetical protein